MRPSCDRPARDRRAPRQDTNAGAAGARCAQRRCDRRRRALGARAPGGRRLLGRDPAAVGLVDPDARRARPRLRGRDLRARAVDGLGAVHGRRRRPPPARGVPVTGLGHRASPCSRCARRRLGPEHPALRCAPADWLLARGGDGRAATGRSAARTRAGRLGVRVRERPLPGRRRHRRGRARPARARPRRRRRRPRARLDGRDAVAQRRLGRVRRRQRGAAGSTSSRSATSARSPTSRAPTSPRTRSRRSRHGGRLRRTRCVAGSTGSSPSRRPDGSWFGRWGVNHVYGTGAALPALEACGIDPGAPGDPAGGGVARLGPATRTAASARTSAPTRDPGLARTRRRDAFTDGLGATSLRRCRRGRTGLSTRRAAEYLCQTQQPNGDWDEAALHGHGFSARLHDPLPPLPAARSRSSPSGA